MMVGKPDTHSPAAAVFSASLRVHCLMASSFPKEFNCRQYTGRARPGLLHIFH
jgi:hypothetical protein